MKSSVNRALIYFAPTLLAALFLISSGAAWAKEVSIPKDRQLYLQTEFFAALLNDMPQYSNLAAGFGYAGRVGWRSDRFGVFAGFERDFWLAHNLDLKVENGVLNLGVGGEVLFFDRRVRTSVSLGTSTLMFDTILDDQGSTGIFVDVRPVGLRWAVLDWLTLEFCPISFTLMAPVLIDHPLKKLEYRSYLTVEVPL